MEEVISVNELFHTYTSGKIEVDALQGISLSVKRGEIFGFIGPNGAGKTTTIKLLLGIHTVQKGNVTILDSDPSRPLSRRRVGYMPETADYYSCLTPRELLFVYGDMFRIERRVLSSRVDEMLELVGLTREAGRMMGTFSKGMKQKVGFAQALINDPDLLILDEPTGGLDPVSRKKMRDVILALKERGKTVFFSSHELSEVELISDRIAVLNRGRVLASGDLSSFLREKGEKQSLERYFLQIIEESL